jgi:hypothetical protein
MRWLRAHGSLKMLKAQGIAHGQLSPLQLPCFLLHEHLAALRRQYCRDVGLDTERIQFNLVAMLQRERRVPTIALMSSQSLRLIAPSYSQSNDIYGEAIDRDTMGLALLSKFSIDKNSKCNCITKQGRTSQAI